MSISIALMIGIMMMMMMTTMVESYHTYEKNRVPRLLDVPRHLRRLREPRHSERYVELCRAMNLKKERLGHVNVFAFLDPSWHYSCRQAIMLELLKKSLDKSGYSNVLFFVIAPPPDLPENDTENVAEINAWREISEGILETDYLDVNETVFNDLAKGKEGIFFLQDSSELSIWETFHAAKDEVVVTDRCGKLTYQIPTPWSILHYPYVKAAILSTYKQDLCFCDMAPDSPDYEEYGLRNVNSSETKTDVNPDTEGTFTELGAASFGRSEDDKNRSTTIRSDINSYENKVYDNATDGSAVQTETIEDMKMNENVKNDTSFIDKDIDTTTEISLEQTQISVPIPNLVKTEFSNGTQDYTSSNEKMQKNNDSFFSIKNSSTSLTESREHHQSEPRVTLEDGKERQQVINGSDEGKELQIQNSESIPLRIILYSPHLHEKNGTLHKYTHLVLKTGSPDYHEHFNSNSKTSDDESVVLRKSNSSISDDKTLAKYVNNTNESPGVFGEIADYWRTTSSEESDENENTDFTDYDYATTEDVRSNVNDVFDRKSNILDSDANIKSNHDSEELVQLKLIEHYNNLLRWIHYKL